MRRPDISISIIEECKFYNFFLRPFFGITLHKAIAQISHGFNVKHEVIGYQIERPLSRTSFKVFEGETVKEAIEKWLTWKKSGVQK